MSEESKKVFHRSASFGLLRRSSKSLHERLRSPSQLLAGSHSDHASPDRRGTIHSKSTSEEPKKNVLVESTRKDLREALGAICAFDPENKVLSAQCELVTQQMETLLRANEDLVEQLSISSKETEELSESWKTSSETTDELRRANQALREKIQLLESNLAMTDYQIAKMAYGTPAIHWESFPRNVKRGVVKVLHKGKARKRYVALRDNFLFLFRPEFLEEPAEVLRLGDIVVTAETKSSFSFKSRGKEYTIETANAAIMISWVQALSFTNAWYDEKPSVPSLETGDVNVYLDGSTDSIGSPRSCGNSGPEEIVDSPRNGGGTLRGHLNKSDQKNRPDKSFIQIAKERISRR